MLVKKKLRLSRLFVTSLVDGAPKNVKEGVSEDEANDIKAKLEEVGATVTVK